MKRYTRMLSGALCILILLSPALGMEASAVSDAVQPAAQAETRNAASVLVDGAELDLTQLPTPPYLEGQVTMVPLRAVAESLGYTVTWLEEDNAIRVENDSFLVTVYIGQDSFCRSSKVAIGMTAPVSFGAPPVVLQGRTYVPAQFFSLLFCQVDVREDQVSIFSQAH